MPIQTVEVTAGQLPGKAELKHFSLQSFDAADSSNFEPGQDVDVVTSKNFEKQQMPREGIDDVESSAPVQTGPPYSVFSKAEKRFITAMITFAAFFSPVSANIYLPILNTLAEDLQVSNALINLTITSYMIFQGIVPIFYGTFADKCGRRPAYIIAFTIYLGANIGLALQHSYVALLLLRCLQSTGSSGTVAIGFGVISDIATTAERGSYLGYVTSGIMLGPALGPIIGGLLAHFQGWRPIFWFLTAGSGTFLIIYVMFVSETSRQVVGNGSLPPQSWNLSAVKWMQLHQKVGGRGKAELEKEKVQKHAERKKLGWPNPLKAVTLLLEKDVAIVVIFNSLIFAAFYDIAATLPSLFKAMYDFNDLQIGLCYLPMGIGACIASVLSGRALDWNYKRVALKNNFTVDKRRGDDLKDFPIEQARLGIIWPTLYISLVAILCYGWALEKNSPLAGPLILLFIIGLSLMTSFNVLGTLLIDLNPDSPATATAGNNLIRCSLGAGATGVVDLMVRHMGRGWCFTFISLFCAAMTVLLLVEYRHGQKWREARRVRLAH